MSKRVSFPPPCDLGLPEQFSGWREGQVDAVLKTIDAPQRFVGQVLPTGFGKSLVYMAVAHLTGRKTVILTSTKALQSQLWRDFQSLDGTVVVQGQRAYLCSALEPGGELASQFTTEGAYRPTYVDHGPCHLGVDCSLKASGCGYFDALRAAKDAKVVITNYAWWFTLVNTPQFRLRPDLLVCDEAHAAPDNLSDAIGASISPELVQRVLGSRMPGSGQLDQAGWIGWAREKSKRLADILEGTAPRTRDAVIRIRQAQTLLHATKRVAEIKPSLLLVSDEPGAIRFDVVWAAPYGEQWLFRHTPHVLMTSATMTPHTADLVGILEKDLFMNEAGDGFPRDRRPVYITPARKPPFGEPLQIDHRLTRENEAIWLEHIDRIIASRKDRKGIIHTVSYNRRDTIVGRSEYRDRMMTHGKHDAATQIAAFKAAPPGTVLVSPSVTTGYDFPYDECEYQIVAKIPMPDARDPVTKARTIVDFRYPAHVAMQELVQSIGRGMRAADDRCETFITDAHAIWFLSKHSDLAPRWFRRAVHRLDAGAIPAAPPRLGSKQHGRR